MRGNLASAWSCRIRTGQQKWKMKKEMVRKYLFVVANYQERLDIWNK
jgi:hypothetical protein